MLDWNSKIILAVIAMALAVLAARPFTEPRATSGGLPESSIEEILKAPPQPRRIEIPRTWGRFVGMTSFTIATEGGVPVLPVAFEGPDGVIRTRVAGCIYCEVVRK